MPEEGITFHGETDNDNEEILPHGQGTWTFPDGSTFYGDNVAFEGVPHGKGYWNYKEETEFRFGERIIPGDARKKIKWN